MGYMKECIVKRIKEVHIGREQEDKASTTDRHGEPLLCFMLTQTLHSMHYPSYKHTTMSNLHFRELGEKSEMKHFLSQT